MVQDAQNWLNNEIPINQRKNITNLSLCSAEMQEDHHHKYVMSSVPMQHRYYFDFNDVLVGELNLNEFVNLQELDINYQLITGLILSRCSNLRKIRIDFNRLETISLPSNGQKIKNIYLSDNNISPRNLSCFANFRNLENLYLGTDDEDNLKKNIYNRWNGSLIHLKNLTKLEKLDISATDIDSGLEYLPTSCLNTFTFGDKGRNNAGVDALKRILNFNEEQACEDGEDCDEVEDIEWKMKFIQEWQEKKQQVAQIQINC